MIVYHFAGQNERGQPVLSKGGIVLKPGLELHMNGPIIPGKRGYHGCVRALDALEYARGTWLNLRLFPDDEFVFDEDQVVSPYMRVVAVVDAAAALHEFACDEAELALTAADITDARSWDAIATKRAWLRGEDSRLGLVVAKAYAEVAAKDADWNAANIAAFEAAKTDPREAAQGAAQFSASSVAVTSADAIAGKAKRDTAWDTAWDAAFDAAWGFANARLEAMLAKSVREVAA